MSFAGIASPPLDGREGQHFLHFADSDRLDRLDRFDHHHHLSPSHHHHPVQLDPQCAAHRQLATCYQSPPHRATSCLLFSQNTSVSLLQEHSGSQNLLPL